MHLNAFNNGNFVHTMCTTVLKMAMLRGKQTNKHEVQPGGTRTTQTAPLLTACQNRWSPPLDLDPPQALLLEQSPHCVCLLWGVSLGERWAASTTASIEAIWAS